MPKSVFVQNSYVPPAWFNALQDIQFDGQDLDGHYQKIPNVWLSDAPGSLLNDVTARRDQLLVKDGGGLTCSINGGSMTGPNGLRVTIAPTTKTLPANASTFVWIDSIGVVQTGATLPVRSQPLAQITTNNAAIVANGIIDLRQERPFLPQSRAIQAFGGSATNDITITSNTTLNGIIPCRNLTINAGVTVTVTQGELRIRASGDVTINGQINVTAPVQGGSGFYGAPVAPAVQADVGRGLGGGGGTNSIPPSPYTPDTSPLGSGGASGFTNLVGYSGGFITTSRGGFGGGSVTIEAAGAINIAGGINCDGTAAQIGIILTPSAGTVGMSGGGGGSGGSINLRSITSINATASASLSVRGGNGAPGNTFGSIGAFGGFGGAGGWIVCRAPSVNVGLATVLLNNGSTGASSNGGGLGGSVGGAFASSSGPGQIVIDTLFTV
jgi:hypothetical protein